MRSSLVALLLLLTGCNSDNIQKKKEEAPPATLCGNGLVDDGEQCDGSELGGHSCTSEGFDYGTLTCAANCQISTGGCVKICGNGMLDPGEQCDGAVGNFDCAEWGYKSCSASCRVEALHCVATAFQPSAPVTQSSGGASVLTDLVPEGYGDLVTAVPDFGRLQTHTFDLTRGFTEARKIMNDRGAAPFLPIAADLDGDGHIDLASINQDGTADRYRFRGTDFVTESLISGFDAGTACRIGHWIGAGMTTRSGPATLYALACPSTPSATTWDAVYVFPGGDSPGPVLTLDVSGVTAAALADDDGDGLEDLFLALGTQEVVIRRAPDFAASTPMPLGTSATLLVAADLDHDGDADLIAYADGKVHILENLGAPGFAERSSENAAPVALIARDLDLDGRPDFAWIESGKVEIRRNTGDFVFAPYSLETGPGTPLSLTAGDLEGDGDPDLAAAVAATGGGTATTTYIFINEVR